MEPCTLLFHTSFSTTQGIVLLTFFGVATVVGGVAKAAGGVAKAGKAVGNGVKTAVKKVVGKG